MKPRILITAAKGNTGLPTAQELVQDGYSVRLFIRRENQAIQQLKRLGAEVFIGDMTQQQDWVSALDDIQRVYYCPPSSTTDFVGTAKLFIAAAQAAGVTYVVNLGQWLAEWADFPAASTQATRRVYTLMDEASFAVTHMIPGWFASNYFFVVDTMTQLGLMPLPLGNGRCNAPSNEDMGRVNAALLKDPVGHEGKRYRPTGPKSLTPDEIAAVFSQVLARKIRYMNISEKMFLKAGSALDLPVDPATSLSQLRYFTEAYRNDQFDGGTDVVEALTGQKPEDFATTARRYLIEAPQQQQTSGSKVAAIRDFMKIAFSSPPTLDELEKINCQIKELNHC